MSKLKVFFITLTISCLLLVGIGAKTYSFDLFNRTCSGDIVKNDQNTNSAVCKDSESGRKDTARNNGIIRIIKTVADIVAVITGVFAVINIILGGFLFATAGGNSENIANARRRIVASLVGLIIVVLAWTITRFIVNRVIQ